MPAGNHAKPRGPLTSFGPDDVSQPLEIATKVAYANRSVPFRDGLIERFTGDQRFLMGWDPVWRGKSREYEQICRIKVDPHSPPSVRGVAPVKNQNAFLDAFDIKDGDKMFLAPAKRVTVW